MAAWGFEERVFFSLTELSSFILMAMAAWGFEERVFVDSFCFEVGSDFVACLSVGWGGGGGGPAIGGGGGGGGGISAPPPPSSSSLMMGRPEPGEGRPGLRPLLGNEEPGESIPDSEEA